MKILVTGASGFIGSNLTERLLKKGHELIGIDKDFEKRYLLNKVIPKEIKMEKKSLNKITDNFSMIWDDINNISSYYYVLDNVDEVYHLAASADIKISFKNPKIDFKNNVLGTNEILEMMRKKEIKKLVFSSSSAIYGECGVYPTPETVTNVRPISLYGSSKLASEVFMHVYSDLYNIKTWIFRFANVVGRHEHRGVIPDFYRKLKQNPKELEILGDGNQQKSYFDVSDCVNGLIEIPKMDGNKGSEVYNLGYETTIKVKDLADVVSDELSLSPEYKFTGGDRGWKGDIPVSILDISKALKAGWKPKYDVEKAIRRTVNYLQETLE